MKSPAPEMISQDIQRQIASHDTEIHRLKQLFNASSQAATFPPHLLSLVFLEYARIFYDIQLSTWYGGLNGRPTDSYHKDIYSWIAVSQVCRHWRESALGCAKLWTLIVLDERIRPSFIKLLLGRSNGLPLTVVLHVLREDCQEDRHCPTCLAPSDEASYNYSRAIGLFKRILPNINTLTVFIAKTNHSEVWDALERLRRATKLQRLTIEAVENMRYHKSRYQDRAYVTVPHNVSSQIPSSLCSLTISGVGFAWSNTLLSASLRHLHVSNYYSQLGEPLSVLLLALNSMPHLDFLHIDLVPAVPPGTISLPRAALPSLQTLQLPIRQSESAAVLLHLDLPDTTSVLLFDTTAYDSILEPRKEVPQSVCDDIARAVASVMKGVNIHAFSAVHSRASCRYNPPSLCSLWTARSLQELDAPPPPWSCPEDTPPKIVFHAGLNSPTAEAIIAALDLSHVQGLKISCDSEHHSRQLIEAVRGAENLSTLHISGEIALPLGAVLSGWTRFRDAEELARVSRPLNQRTGEHDALPDWYGFGDVADDVYGDPAVEDAIEENRSNYRPCGGPYPLFPHLRRLVITHVDFMHSSRKKKSISAADMFRSFYGVPYGFDAKAFAKSLRLRPGQGVSSVVCVEFAHCLCNKKEQLLPLINVVDEVVWDGKRLTVEDINT